MGCSEWTGVRLADVLKAAGVKPGAVYTAHYGADTHLSGKEGKLPISRGAPIAKALTDNVPIAFAMNGGPLHPQNGAPLRPVVPGWPGSCSQKWLQRIQIRDMVHDGPKMTGTSYRAPRYPVAPGDKAPKEDFEIIERMPVKSLVTAPENGGAAGRRAEVRGHAWSGDRTVSAVDISIDFGKTWAAADLDAPVNPGAWQNWRRTVAFPEAGYYEVWARATDSAGDFGAAPPAPAAAPEPEDFGVMVAAPGASETFDACTPCHSERIVAQQGLTREQWDELLDWMVEEQEMEPIEAGARAVILDYLAGHYGPDRPNFPAR